MKNEATEMHKPRLLGSGRKRDLTTESELQNSEFFVHQPLSNHGHC